MKTAERKVFRCAIYTRKSTEHNLDLEFNSLDAQREACQAYIKSQAHEGCVSFNPFLQVFLTVSRSKIIVLNFIQLAVF
jgi:DNA invertase Pin-like site-specific DNA recombinase